MVRTSVWLVALLLALSARPQRTVAQSGQDVASFQHAIEMRVRVAHAPIYNAPRRTADVVRTLAWNERLLVLRQNGSFYHVVAPAEGLQGYVLSTQLRAANRPLGEDDMPEDLRRRRNYVGARFDVQAGVAVPYRSAAFANQFNPGSSIDVRLSHPLSGPLGLAARISYRQFGRVDEAASLPLQERIDVRGRDLSMLSGAIGFDLTAFRGHWIAFVATADGGVYHIIASGTGGRDTYATGDAASLFAWGGSVSIRMSARLGGPVRLFAEPGYEVVRSDQGALHLLPMRVGLSLER